MVPSWCRSCDRAASARCSTRRFALYRARFGVLMTVSIAVLIPVSILSMFVLLSALPDEFRSAVTHELAGLRHRRQRRAARRHPRDLGPLRAGHDVRHRRDDADRRRRLRRPASPTRATRSGPPAPGRCRSSALTLVVTRRAPSIGFFVLLRAGRLAAGRVVPSAIPVLLLEGTGVFRALGRSFAAHQGQVLARVRCRAG